MTPIERDDLAKAIEGKTFIITDEQAQYMTGEQYGLLIERMNKNV